LITRDSLRPRFLVVTDVGLDPRRGSAPRRLTALVEMLLEAGYPVIHAHLLEDTGGPSAPLRELARRHDKLGLLGRLDPAQLDLPHFDALYLANLWNGHALSLAFDALEVLRGKFAPFHTVLDTMDCLVKHQQPYYPPDRLAVLSQAEYRLRRAVEHQVLVTEVERQEVIARFELPAQRVHVVPNVHSIYLPGFERDFAERVHICYVGTIHNSNLEGLHHFLAAILPAVMAKHLNLEFHIIGHGMDALSLALPPDMSARVRIFGQVELIEPVVSGYRLQVVPLLNGSGIKGKLLESLACGTPVVSTPKGVESMAVVSDRELVIAENPEQFANRVVELYEDETRWRTVQQGGRDYIEIHNTPPVVGRTFDALLKSVFG
jgi:glycosyltransferase involved in cell wall biosynthesis